MFLFISVRLWNKLHIQVRLLTPSSPHRPAGRVIPTLIFSTALDELTLAAELHYVLTCIPKIPADLLKPCTSARQLWPFNITCSWATVAFTWFVFQNPKYPRSICNDVLYCTHFQSQTTFFISAALKAGVNCWLVMCVSGGGNLSQIHRGNAQKRGQ